MDTSRRRRIGPDDAERLLATGRDPAYPELSRLLGAVAAPPRPRELAGLPAAVAAFEEAGRLARPTVESKRRRALRPLAAAAALAAMLVGGVAVAAETGNLPGGARTPAASGTARADAPPRPTTNGDVAPGHGPSGTPGTTPPSSDRGRTISPTSPTLAGLCRAWDAHRRNPQKDPVPAEAMRDLTAAAGGEERIPELCAPVLPRPATPSHPTGKGTGKPTPSPARRG
jgi:hypothetical protein